MARVKRGVTSHRRHKKILRQAKGYYGNRSKIYRVANQAVMRSLQYAYAHRKLRKRDFRKLWIARINAACRMNDMSYSRFINGFIRIGWIDGIGIVACILQILYELRAVHHPQGLPIRHIDMVHLSTHLYQYVFALLFPNLQYLIPQNMVTLFQQFLLPYVF